MIFILVVVHPPSTVRWLFFSLFYKNRKIKMKRSWRQILVVIGRIASRWSSSNSRSLARDRDREDEKKEFHRFDSISKERRCGGERNHIRINFFSSSSILCSSSSLDLRISTWSDWTLSDVVVRPDIKSFLDSLSSYPLRSCLAFKLSPVFMTYQVGGQAMWNDDVRFSFV